MKRKKQTFFVQGSLFEEDYLIRSLGSLAHSPDIALTELVANAWDAGASRVDIMIPDSRGEQIVIKDDGTGLTGEHFHSRWMKLGYNRIKHQGDKVVFPPGKNGTRLAYGRNGVGRHGLLCFNTEYQVETISEGIKSCFVVTTQNEDQPFVLNEETASPSEEVNGTTLKVVVKRNLPDPERILEVLSARFLHDPQFTVYINGKSVPLENHTGLIDSTEIEVNGCAIKLHFIDSQKAARSTLYQGIAFWQSGRLVGEPSWVLGGEAIIDGRTRFAKRYTVVAKTQDLAKYISEDWTGFRKHQVMDSVYKCLSEYVVKMFGEIAREHIDETKQQVKHEFSQRIKELSPLGRYEVDEAIEIISTNYPTARQEAVSLAVEAIINLEKTRTGKELLKKISELSERDIEGLNRLLDQWTVKDALCVLDEIDNRISVIEAIRKLSSDKDVDELKILHPLVTEARWLFGPEFDSPEYASNRQLVTVVKDLFGTKLGSHDFENHRRRPDLVVVGNSTLSVTGTERIDSSSGMSTVQTVLIIELKRGGFELTRNERNQAQGYVEDFSKCGSLIGSPYVHSFVVGEFITKNMQPITTIQNDSKVECGKVHVTTYAQLVDTAEKRIFRLRERLSERYDDIPGLDLFQRTVQTKIWDIQ